MSFRLAVTIVVLFFCSIPTFGESCTAGFRVEGTVLDPDGRLIEGAQVTAIDGSSTQTNAKGYFVLPCVSSSATDLTVEAGGFASSSVHAENTGAGSATLTVKLALAQVHADVSIAADSGSDAPVLGSQTLNTKQVEQLADDPDDLTRELQALAATAGGGAANATITVDGFENASALPPKNTIASVNLNPDLFSPQYEFPPFEGGHIEITTKPGLGNLHGSVFFTDSDGSFNATDPFSLTATPASKRRYGFSVGGPIVKKKSGFNLSLEKRDINEFNVVNAITLDANNNQEALQQAVQAPQRLWIASARADAQITPSESIAVSFSANVNNLGNQGVGGLTLAEAGFDSHVSEYDLRIANTLVLGPHLLDQTRIGYSWKDTAQTPLSTAPQLQVAGFFTGGGSTAQALNNRERDLEINNNLFYDHGKHTIKLGVRSLAYYVHDNDPDTFNGAFIFGGGSAPVLDANNQPLLQTTNITALEQYRRANLNLAGGTPTEFQITTGDPLVAFTQWKVSIFAEDAIKLTPHLTFTTGLRYQLQTSPDTSLNFGPRAGLAWAFGKNDSTVLHARIGLFSESSPLKISTEAFRLNGILQDQALVYSPSFTSPLTPTGGALQVNTVRSLPHTLGQNSIYLYQFGGEQSLPYGWRGEVSFFAGVGWNGFRTRNINAPLVASSNGVPPDPTSALLAPRPLQPNLNILQFQNSGHLSGNVLQVSLSQQSYKYANVSMAWIYETTRSDAGNSFDSPQSTYSEAGEASRADWQNTNNLILTGNLNLPRKVQFSTEIDAQTGNPYNITTGTDSNGDGIFNDRPSFTTAPGNGVYATRYGLLTTNTVNGNVPRNFGTMPSTVHVDANLSRAFALDRGKDSHRTLTLNLRSANLINHTNVTAVGTVVSSPNFAQGVAAEAARRLELGARVSF
jgi:hypothetical protein